MEGQLTMAYRQTVIKLKTYPRLGYSTGLHLAILDVAAESCSVHCYFTGILFFLKLLIYILRLLGCYSQSHFFFALTTHFYVSTNINISMTLNKQMQFCLLGQKKLALGMGEKRNRKLCSDNRG